MSLLDILILIPLIWGAYTGYQKGLLIELISLLVIVFSILLSFKMLHSGMSMMGEYIKTAPAALPVITFAILFIVLLLGLSLLGKALKNILHQTIFKDFDQVLGGALGLMKFTFIVSNFLWIIEKADSVFGKGIINQSILFPIIKPFAQVVYTGIAWIFPFAASILKDLAIFLK